MGALRLDLTSVRRAVGAVLVSLLLSGAVVYALSGPDVLSSGSSRDTTANPAPTGAVTQRAPPSTLTPSGGPAPTSDPRPSTPTSTPGAGDGVGSGSAGEAVQVAAPASARLFETVRIRGVYQGGAGRSLEVQRWESGRWRAFPLPTKTDQSGRFTAYVELGQTGRHWLRIRDRDSGTRSKPFLLVIRG